MYLPGLRTGVTIFKLMGVRILSPQIFLITFHPSLLPFIIIISF